MEIISAKRMADQTCYYNGAFTPTSGAHEITLETGNLHDSEKMEIQNGAENRIGSDTLYEELTQNRKANLYESLFPAKSGASSTEPIQQTAEENANITEIPTSHSTRAADETDETFESKTSNIYVWPGKRLWPLTVSFTFVLALIAVLLVVLLIFGVIEPRCIKQHAQVNWTNKKAVQKVSYEGGAHAVRGKACKEIPQARGQFDVLLNGKFVSVYCDGNGWTLVAKFSNTDVQSWMRSDAFWWYDITRPQGKYNVPSNNADGISSAFWLLDGNEFKITRTDDPSHTALLQTTSNCLGEMTFREKVTSYGNFRDGVVWASDACRGSCEVVLGTQYSSTEGFQQAKCNSTIGSPSKISFWCDWSGDGAVMMIGGGGDLCSRADHGIGVTEVNEAKFYNPGPGRIPDSSDYGNGGYTTFSKYGLNLWVR